MHDVLFGLETELAFSAWRTDGEPTGRSREAMLIRFFDRVREQVRFLPEQDGSGMFFENASRFYLDCGDHPELSTAECRTPEELVRWQLAGERLLADAAVALEKEEDGVRVALFRCNVDYSGMESVWGCHESYLFDKRGREMPGHLVPHLVTRLVYTGAGGFDNRKPELEFMLSPRVSHLMHEVGPGNSPERGIFHAKNESLAGGSYKRLHLMCGESLSSQLSNYLKVGTTALVVRLIEAGLCTGKRLAFESPLAAMRCFADDPSCRAEHRLADGRRLTATQVQREYLEMVERHVDADFMPAWTADVCIRWREVLDALVEDPESLGTRLDWAIKHALFQQRARDRDTTLADLGTGSQEGAALCEIDTRFGELGERGLFHALDRAGALDHHIAELGSVEEARTSPPPGARAEARGKAIRELQEKRDDCRVGWEEIVDGESDRRLDLSDPFEADPTWHELPDFVFSTEPSRRRAWSHLARRDRTPDPFAPARTTSSAQAAIARGRQHQNQTDIPRAVREYSRGIGRAAAAHDFEGEALGRFWRASALADGGDLAGVRDTLGPALARAETFYSGSTRVRLWSRYTLALIERPARKAAIEESIAQARRALAAEDGETGRSRVSMLEGRLHGARGLYAEAIASTERAIDEHTSDRIAFQSTSYFYWIVNFCMRDGNVAAAKSFLEMWKTSEGSRRNGDVYVAGTLGCSEADVACADGKPEEAMEILSEPLRRTEDSQAFRWRIPIRCAAVRAAIAAGELERAGPLLDELLGLRSVQVTHLASEIQRLDALYHLRLAARTESIAEVVADPQAFAAGTHAISLELRKFRVAYRRAHAKAETLDDHLQTRRHTQELAESIRTEPL